MKENDDVAVPREVRNGVAISVIAADAVTPWYTPAKEAAAASPSASSANVVLPLLLVKTVIWFGVVR